MSNSPAAERLRNHNNKSPSGLRGMERPLPPSMAARNKSSQSPTHYKPLPPTPSLGRRISLSPPQQQFIFEEQGSRRTSSIYSRTASAWYKSEGPPRAPSLSEHPLPKINSIYRDSVLSPSATMSEPQLLLPRTYKPLIRTPSPLTSTESSPMPRPPLEQRPSALLPLPEPHQTLPRKHLHTVSLEAAQAIQHAPGTEHLLPEELRARTIAKARSSEHIVKLADQNNDKPQKPGSAFKAHESTTIRLPSVMMLDAGTWHSFDPSLHVPAATLPQKAYAAPVVAPRWSGSTAIAMSRDQSLSQTGSTVTSEPPVDEPERGRTLQRVPRGTVKNDALHLPADAGKMAAYYTSLLSPWNDSTPSQSPATDSRDQSSSSVKLTPQPLFAFKSIAGPPGTVHNAQNEGSTSSVSPRGQPITQDESWDSDSHFGTPPPAAFFDTDEESLAKPDSRTGSIPISAPLMAPPLPPSPTIPSPPLATAQPAVLPKPRLMSAKTKKQNRESAYYPYVGRRRGKTRAAMSAAKKSTLRSEPNIAVQAARAAAQKTVSSAAQAPHSKLGDASELLSRATQKAAKLAGKLTRPAEQEVQPTSPAHLSQSVTAVYLGWSEESKEDFDASKALSPKLHYAAGKYSPRPTVKQTYTHVVTPARPLDERPIALADSSEFKRPGHLRKGSILGFFDMSREKGREKRREDIKKTIRVIPDAPGGSSESRPPLEPKSASEADVPSEPQPAAPRMGIWGRRISEFGMI